MEQLTWVQLGRHDKPVLIADLQGFWAPLLALLDHMRDTGFIRRPYGRAIWFATASRTSSRRCARRSRPKRIPGAICQGNCS